MKLLRVGEAGAERPAVMLDDGTIIDVSSAVGEIDGAWLESGGVERLAKIDADHLGADVGVELGNGDALVRKCGLGHESTPRTCVRRRDSAAF